MKRLLTLLLVGLALAAVGACSSDSGGTSTDTTPPGVVTGLTATAGDEEVSLSWDNPTDTDFAGVTLRRTSTGVLAGPEDGTEVYDGSGSSCEDTGLNNGSAYTYAAFAYDEAGNFSEAGTAATGMPSATAPCPDSHLGEFCYTVTEGTLVKDGDYSITATGGTVALVFDKTVAQARAQVGLSGSSRLYVSVHALIPEVAGAWLDVFAYVTPPTETEGAGGLLAELERYDTGDMYRFATLIGDDISGSTNTGTIEAVYQPGSSKWLHAYFENDTTADTAAVTVYNPDRKSVV